MSLRVSDYTCANCGIEFRGRGGARRKFCGVCQAHRDITFMGDRGKTCEDCQKLFFPARTNYRYCYTCQDPHHGLPAKHPKACKRCGEHNLMPAGLEETCTACVQKDVKARRAYHKKLGAIIRERSLAHFPTTQEASA